MTKKSKELKNMGKEEREKKLKDLKADLIKAKVNTSKSGSSKVKEIKKMIARILTLKQEHGYMPKMWLA
ncbi:MAG: 50S ribosomal protein L29 [archaeon]